MFRPLLDRFLSAAAASPSAECLVDGTRRVPYGAMAGHVEAAGRCIGRHAAPGDRVAILAESSPEYVAACYGAWWVGGVAVGLNTALRAPDLEALIDHCGASCLVADPAFRGLPDLEARLGGSLPVVPVPPAGSVEPGPGGPRGARPDDLACFMYTSGTTGRPKGVMLSHGNLAANTDSICAYLGIGPGERAMCVLPFHYSFGASILHTHLTTGGSVVIERSFMYPQVVLEKMAAERVTSFAGVPSTYYMLLQRTDVSAHDLSSLRYVTQAGGYMEYARIQEFRRRAGGVPFVVMYGQTEATARLTWVPPELLERKAGSAGRAIPGVELCVRTEEDDRPLPPGETGEVCARGGNVMVGYWNDPEETARILKGGWLRTGDLGLMDEDGFLFLKGRVREMIKSGAHRICPAEIEDVIRGVRGVEDVAVAGVADDLLGQAVMAFVIAAEPSPTLRREILRACRERLAMFKVPRDVAFRESFPRTGSGKIRKHLLETT